MIAATTTTPTPTPKTPKEKRSSKKWRQQRFLVWLRDDFRCVYCGQDLLRDFQTLFCATVDHVKPESQAGDDSISNLATCCASCNNLKGSAEPQTIETAREEIAYQRANVMGHFIAMAKEYGVQFPRRDQDVTPQAMLAYDALATLKAFVYSSHRITKQIEAVAYRAERVDESLAVLETFRGILDAPTKPPRGTNERLSV